MLLSGKAMKIYPNNSKLAASYLGNLQFRAFQSNQKLMVLAVSLYLHHHQISKHQVLSLSVANITKRELDLTLIRLQKADFAQIQLLFSTIYCLYEQAGSFPSTFFESWPSKDILGKYFSQWEPLGTQEKANRVTIVVQSPL